MKALTCGGRPRTVEHGVTVAFARVATLILKGSKGEELVAYVGTTYLGERCQGMVTDQQVAEAAVAVSEAVNSASERELAK